MTAVDGDVACKLSQWQRDPHRQSAIRKRACGSSITWMQSGLSVQQLCAAFKHTCHG